MKLGKKLISAIAVTVACVSLATVTTFAASTSAGAYGTLVGTLSGSSGTTTARTSITYNNDNAYLSFLVADVNSNGTTLSTSSTTSSRGERSLLCLFGYQSSAYALYGTHGVQGGSSSYAVYTYTKL